MYKGLVDRERRQYLGRWKGNVQEKTKWVVDAEPTQGCTHRDHVIVVDPHEIVGSENRREALGEHFVDPAVGRPLFPAVLGEVDSVMEDRPQNAIGKLEIVTAVIRPLEIDQRLEEVAVAL